MPKLLIIGAGISGLATAFFLKDHCDIQVIEKESRAGGLIQSDRVDGFLCERGPRGCRSSGHGKLTLQLAHDLGLKDEIVFADPRAKSRYLWYQGKLQKLSLPFLLKQGLLSEIFLEPFRKKARKEDESIASFFRRRFGNRTAEILASSLTTGIFAGDMEKLSMRSCLNTLWKWERLLPRALFSGSSKLFSFKDGMSTLTDRLYETVKSTITFGQEVVSYQEGRATLKNGKEISYDYIVDTTPKDEIERVSVALVHLGYKSKVIPKKGYGYLIPDGEDKHLLGVVFDSCHYPTQNSGTKLTVMLGGARFPTVISTDPDTLIKISLEAIKRQVGIDRRPDMIDCHVCRAAIPQYPVGYENFKEAAVAVNDLIAKASRLAKKIAIQLQ